MSKIKINQIDDNEVEVILSPDTPMSMVQSLTKSLIAKGLVEDLVKSTVSTRCFYKPQDPVNDLADKLIKSLQGLTKDEEPYWSTKSKFAQQKKIRDIGTADRRASAGVNTSPAPAQNQTTVPSAKPGAIPHDTAWTAGGTGRRYAFVKGERVECDHSGECDCSDKPKRKIEPVKKSTGGWANHNRIPNAEEEMAKMKKSQAERAEDIMANQLANLMAGKAILGNKPPAQPTDEEMFGHLVVTDEMAKARQNEWNGTLNNFFAEASKPLSQRFSSQEEEEAYWASIKVGDRDDGSSGY